MTRGILLIDDDKIANLINSKVVEKEFPGVPMVIFENGLQALEYIGENPKTPFLIFLDINMPIMNGWDFLEAISRLQDKADLQIHILTSSVDKGDQAKANQYKQVRSFLDKPLNKTKVAYIKKEFIEL